jgi:hypothetical protein
MLARLLTPNVQATGTRSGYAKGLQHTRLLHLAPPHQTCSIVTSTTVMPSPTTDGHYDTTLQPSLAPGLRDVRPTFVEWSLRGLGAALRERNGFEWAPVIELMCWIVEQPREIPEGRQDKYSGLDSGWVLTRREIVTLLERGLKLEDERAIPAGHRDDVWHVISAIATDPDPTPEHEERYGGSNMDPLTLALNTTRPRAIFAAVAYGVWLHRILHGGKHTVEGADDALFAEAPELARLLEERLDASADPSVAVRAAIGHFFADLLALDAAWAQEHAARIFPDDDSPLREAAWGAYVIYTRPYDKVLSALRAVYERSAELAGESGHGFRWDTTPQAKLGEHLATFYWRGTIELDDRLLQVFWRRAPSEARRHVIDFLGRSVRDFPELERDVQARLLAFWDFAREQATHAETLDDLAPFAWWFASEALPLSWRIDNLLALLNRKVKPDPAFAVVEELPAVAQKEPLRAVEALRRLLELEQDRWQVDAWRDEIEQILRHALSQDDPDARRTAEDTVHWLGALGYRTFRALLD